MGHHVEEGAEREPEGSRQHCACRHRHSPDILAGAPGYGRASTARPAATVSSAGERLVVGDLDGRVLEREAQLGGEALDEAGDLHDRRR